MVAKYRLAIIGVFVSILFAVVLGWWWWQQSPRYAQPITLSSEYPGYELNWSKTGESRLHELVQSYRLWEPNTAVVTDDPTSLAKVAQVEAIQVVFTNVPQPPNVVTTSDGAILYSVSREMVGTTLVMRIHVADSIVNAMPSDELDRNFSAQVIQAVYLSAVGHTAQNSASDRAFRQLMSDMRASGDPYIHVQPVGESWFQKLSNIIAPPVYAQSCSATPQINGKEVVSMKCSDSGRDCLRGNSQCNDGETCQESVGPCIETGRIVCEPDSLGGCAAVGYITNSSAQGRPCEIQQAAGTCFASTCPDGQIFCGGCVNGCRAPTKKCGTYGQAGTWIGDECANTPPPDGGGPGNPPPGDPVCQPSCSAPLCGQEDGCGTGNFCSNADGGIGVNGPIIRWPYSADTPISQQGSLTLYWDAIPKADWYLLYLYPSKNPNADMTTPGMGIADSYFANDATYHPWYAFDHYTSTGWASNTTGAAVNGGAWVGVDFGAGRTHHVRNITIQQYAVAETQIATIQVQYSDNGSSWTNAGGNITIAKNGSANTYGVAATGEHRYWRVIAREATADGYAWGLLNLEFKGDGPATLPSNYTGFDGIWTQNTQYTFTPTTNGYLALVAAANYTCASGGEWTEWGGAAISSSESGGCTNPANCPPVPVNVTAPLEGRVLQGTATLSGGKCVGTGTALATAATDITTGAAAYSSGDFGSGWEAGRSNDNNINTAWASLATGASVNDTTWLAYDAGTPQPASRFMLRQYHVPNNTVGAVQWFASNDWQTWTASGTISVSQDGEKRQYNTGIAGSFRYWVMVAKTGLQSGFPWVVYEVELVNGAGAATAATVNGTGLFPDGSYRVSGALTGNNLALTLGAPLSGYQVMCPAGGSYANVAGPGNGYDFYVSEPYIRGNVYVATGSVSLVNGKCVGSGVTPTGTNYTALNQVVGESSNTTVAADGTYALNQTVGNPTNVSMTFDAGTNYTCVCPAGCQYTNVQSPGSDYDFYYVNQNITGTVYLDSTPGSSETTGGLCTGAGTIPSAAQINDTNNVTTNTGSGAVQSNGTYSVNANYGTTTPVTLNFDAGAYYGCTCPGGCQYTNQTSPAANRNFYIVPSNVTGTVYSDPSGTATLVGGRCTGPTGAANTSGMQVTGTNGGSYNNTVSVAANGTYTLGIPYSGAGVISATLNLPAGAQMICTCPAGCTYGNVTPLETNVNYYTSLAYGPWFQVIGGPVMAYATSGTALRSNIPATCTSAAGCKPYLITRSSGAGTSGYLLTGGGSVDLSPTAGVQTNTVNEDGNNGIGVVDPEVAQERYSHFIRRFLFPENPGSDFGAGASDAQKPTATPVNSNANAYYHNGDVRVQDAWNVGAGESLTIFVAGDLRIANQVQVAEGGFLAFIVQGDIIIEASVGTATVSSTVGQVEGVYIADGEIQLPSAGTASGGDLKFVGEGTFVGWSGIELNRNYDDGGNRVLLNNTNPTEVFRYRPDFLLNAPDELRLPQVQWREVAP